MAPYNVTMGSFINGRCVNDRNHSIVFRFHYSGDHLQKVHPHPAIPRAIQIDQLDGDLGNVSVELAQLVPGSILDNADHLMDFAGHYP